MVADRSEWQSVGAGLKEQQFCRFDEQQSI
jgi:hypothetical protein